MDWVVKTVIPLREAMGYKVHWRFLAEDKTEFIWLVSSNVSPEEFEAKDKAWMASPERAEAVINMPASLLAVHTKFVNVV